MQSGPKVRRVRWRTKLPEVKHAILPPSTTRPNPLVVGDLVIASIFAPGAVCAVNRGTGKLIWRRLLDNLAGSAVSFANGIVFAKTAHSIYALDYRTGGIRWEFTPRKQPGEWIYSQPVVYRGRLFFGDRTGMFHCLEAMTGRPLWRRRTSRNSNADVNATALAIGTRVITACNAGMVVCYDTRTGETIWRQRVDGPCINQLLQAGPNVVVGAQSLYALDSRSGAVRFNLSYPERTVYSMTVADRRVVAILGPDAPAGARYPESLSMYELVTVGRGKQIVRRPVEGISSVRTCETTGLVYRVGVVSMEVIGPATGSSLLSMQRQIGLPDFADGYLYGLTSEGTAFAERIQLKNPEVRRG